VIKELILKFKVKENPQGIKGGTIILQYSFKIEVMNYAEKHGNRADERRFGSPLTEKTIREWRKQRKDLIKADKSKQNFMFMCS
jgi:hypothetical protein